MTLDNLTPWPVEAFPSYDTDGRDILVIVAAASFDIPAPGSTALRPSAEQPPVPLEDRYHGEPGISGPVQAAQTAPFRPGADIHVRGCVRCAVPTGAVEVSLEVAELRRAAWVVGDRQWRRRVGGWEASEAEPFVTMPIAWERCHGGPDEARNRVGCHPPRGTLEGFALPNFEHPGALVQHPQTRLAPLGFGPVPPQWSPRLEHAGTYDEEWQRARAPYWPEDFNPRFFHAAPEGLRRAHFIGDEPITLVGFLPGQARHFRLPSLRLLLKSRSSSGAVARQLLRIDGVELDLDAERLTLYARATIDLADGLGRFAGATLRSLHGWESSP
ncbi:putative exported protein [Enhygromyxa salina]|uniref:Putative exported protein n=1 Tax=Enhygromyxa salina TaxID=215803 RepID=A0A0C2D7J5_9BACT|nr:DUF2169 domain-containing protein [Enhygromyxa salina]KIG19131.1 putative exported protein [Enhygromyxa salina]